MHTYSIFNTITAIGKDQWDSIVRENNIICSYNFLKAVEASRINDCEFYYLTIFNNKELVAHTCFYTMSMEMLTIANKKIKKIVKFIQNIIPSFLKIKVTECGCPVAMGNTINMTGSADVNEVLKIIINVLEETAIKKKAPFVLLRDYTKKEIDKYSALKERGYYSINQLPVSEMSIAWKDFEDYTGNLKYTYRKHYKVCSKKIKNENISMFFTNEYKEYVPRIRRLYLNCYENAKEYQREIITEEFFYNMLHCIDKESGVLIIKLKDKVVGFGFILLDGSVVRALFVGIDYKENIKYRLYYNLCYEVVKIAIEKGFKHIDFGATAYEFKACLGAKLIPLFVYAKHLNPTVDYILKTFHSSIFPQRKVNARRPFKKEI